MDKNEYKIERAKIKAVRQAAELTALRDVSLGLIHNPIVNLVGGFTLIELLQRYPSSKPIMGTISGTVAEGLIGGVVVAQQLANVLPAVGELAGPLLPLMKLAA